MIPPRINFSGFQYQSALLSLNDLKLLFLELEPFEFFNVSQVLDQNAAKITTHEFLEFYHEYLEALFLEKELDYKKVSVFFSQAIASSFHCFYKQELASSRFLLKPKRSVLQMQPLGLFASSIDRKIHTKSFAKDALSFGIKFNFPTIYEDTSLHEIIELKTIDIEYAKYIKLRQFLRHHTKPMMIEGNGEKNIYPFRYSEELIDKICKLSFFEKNGLKVLI
jgi:hypothetical protein